MEVKYETEKKELEIERQQNVISRQNMQRGLLAGGVIVCVLILALLWMMLRLRTKRNHALAEMNATKDKFFSIISHDLKNPTLTQRDTLQMLLDHLRTWDADTLEVYIKELVRSSNGQVELLYNLLNWAQVQTGRMPFQPNTFNFATRFRSELGLMRTMAGRKGISLEVEMPEEVLVTGDANMLSTVVRNLLTNAIKFTPSGGVVTLAVTPSGNGQYTVSVSDTGSGMSREQISNLFRIDRQRSLTGTAGEQGTGLGLIVCKELIEKHGSTLHVESEPGKSSRFWFSVPSVVLSV
jgi:signal transduction histidine kinase